MNHSGEKTAATDPATLRKVSIDTGHMVDRTRVYSDIGSKTVKTKRGKAGSREAILACKLVRDFGCAYQKRHCDASRWWWLTNKHRAAVELPGGATWPM